MKKLLFGFLIVLLVIGTVACASGQEQGPYTRTSGANDGITMTVPTVTQAPVPTIIISQPPPTTTAVLMPPVAISPEKGGVGYDISYATSVDRMVIRTAYLTIVVDDVSAALQQINTLAESYGGFVVNSNISEDRNRLYAYISFRVDSARFNDTLQTMRNLAADVKSESTSGQDVTEQYTDLASRLRNLEATETQLLIFMEKATTVEELLAVQKELTNTREYIEVIKGQMQYLEQSSSLASFTVTLEQSKLVVEFTADTRTVKEGNSVQFFTDVSGGFYPYSYEWNFGDDETSTEANPSHVYRSGGDFTVTLKVTDDKGTTETYDREDYITVLPGWSAGSVVDGAWNALVSLFRFLGSIFIGLGIWSPLWIIILVILYFAWWRRRKKKA
ncbi:MAG: hypothetical protein A2Y58_02295 [Chloroflexi bacterium RBG_13_51_52]|nr:MAG: hypothetical protein A2Y58_02295 [Chloroflexi bacterium RBG_13_51_52]